MPAVTFITDKEQKFDVAEGITILDAAEQYDIPLPHLCGGAGACGTCHVYVRSGIENLSEMTDEEADRLDDAEDVRTNSRLGCFCTIHGDVVVEVVHPE